MSTSEAYPSRGQPRIGPSQDLVKGPGLSPLGNELGPAGLGCPLEASSSLITLAFLLVEPFIMYLLFFSFSVFFGFVVACFSF